MATRKTTWTDFEDVAKEAAPRPGPRCHTCRFLEKLPSDAVAAIEKTMDNPGITATAIRNALISKVGGNVPTNHAIARHRRKECRPNE